MWGTRGRRRTPGPTPAMMAIGLVMVRRWDAAERRRVVGFMRCGEEGSEEEMGGDIRLRRIRLLSNGEYE